jgi:hypothetical protein
MIIGQPRNIVIERIEPCRCQNARLAHAATQHFAGATGGIDQILSTDQHRANRGTQAFRRTDLDAVKWRGEVGNVDAKGDAGVERPRTIQMKTQGMAPGDFADSDHISHRQHAATKGVFERNHPRARIVAIVGLMAASISASASVPSG